MADFQWDSAQGVYRTVAGQIVPDADIRAGLDAVIRQGQARLSVLSQRLAEGQIDILGFRERVQAELRTGHTAAGMLAHGGRQAMDPRTRGYLGSAVRAQNDYLSILSLDWSQGRMTPAQLQARLSMYPEAFHSTYEAVRRRDAPTRGHDQERNVLGGAREHCAGCTSATGAGWVAVGTLSPPGSRQCVSRCRCTLEFRAARVAVEA